MTSSADIQQCDYLHSHKLPHVFTSERAEVIYLNEQIRSLDSHLSQLNTLRRVLHDRSCQLHNTLAPIRTLPVEVLSYIFQQFSVDIGRHPDPGFNHYQESLDGALVLSSVSSHFRRVAFATPGLWRHIPLHITDNKGIGKASALLQHCIALASSVNISISTRLHEEEARSAVDILLTSKVTRKVKKFELYKSFYTSVWVEKLNGSSFGKLDALKITECANPPHYNLWSLKTLTRLNISCSIICHTVVVPPSLQRLNVRCITLTEFLSLFRQSLNLVECEVYFDSESFDDWANHIQSTQPITHNNLKRLASNVLDVTEMSLLTEKIRLPSIKTLQLECYANWFTEAIPLCRSVSATLTTLVLHAFSNALDFDDLYDVCRLPFPKVERLEFWSCHLEPFWSAIHGLALLDGDYSNPETRHIPALKFVELRYDGDVRPRSLLDSLKKRRIGQAFHFHIQLDRHGLPHRAWSPNLRRELKSIVGERRIKVMWEDHWLV